MVIGDRLRQIRDYKNLSQGDIEKRTGLLRCYVSRVEQGHTTPSIETLEKFARALEVQMYELFYEGEAPPKVKIADADTGWGSRRHDARTLSRFRRLLNRAKPGDVKLLMFMATAMAHKIGRKKNR